MTIKRIEHPFYHDASIEIHRRAAILRKNMTDAEKALWGRINKYQVKGAHFRRQHPIGKFIVDFYCHEALLVIEIDGGIHNKEDVKERDEGREFELRKKGLNILRFTNEDVVGSIDKVIDKIRRAIPN